jgi:hypothetical protein
MKYLMSSGPEAADLYLRDPEQYGLLSCERQALMAEQELLEDQNHSGSCNQEYQEKQQVVIPGSAPAALDEGKLEANGQQVEANGQQVEANGQQVELPQKSSKAVMRNISFAEVAELARLHGETAIG